MLPRTLPTLALLASLVACTGQADPGRQPGPQPTPIDAYRTEGTTLPRAPLCSLIPEGPVTRAVGGDASTAHYDNGHGFGEPATGSVCVSGDHTEAAYRGLFGDTWLTCQLSRPRRVAVPEQEQLLEKAGEWCVAVVDSVRVRG